MKKANLVVVAAAIILIVILFMFMQTVVDILSSFGVV